MAFYRKGGKENVIVVTAKTATAIAVGDLVKIDGNNNQVDAATTNISTRVGIALSAKAATVAGTISVDLLSDGEWFVGTVESGTPAAGDFDTCDLNSADGVTLTASNNDFVYMYNGTTDTVDLLLNIY